jgi:hypothetical protein
MKNPRIKTQITPAIKHQFRESKANDRTKDLNGFRVVRKLKIYGYGSWNLFPYHESEID